MKWFAPKDGDKKQKRFFAILPVTIGLERRWLEMVAVEYEYNYWRKIWWKKRFVE